MNPFSSYAFGFHSIDTQFNLLGFETNTGSLSGAFDRLRFFYCLPPNGRYLAQKVDELMVLLERQREEKRGNKKEGGSGRRGRRKEAERGRREEGGLPCFMSFC